MAENLRASWNEAEFRRMQDDGVSEYRIQFDDGSVRTTTFTVIAYFARLDPEATVSEVGSDA